MLILTLYALGVGPGAILGLLIALLLFKRWKTIHDPSVYKARVRLTAGEFPGLKGTWKKCYAAWVTTVLTTRKGLPLNIADVLPMATLERLRAAEPADAIKGLGDSPMVASFVMTTGAKVDLAMAAESVAVGSKPRPSTSSPIADARARPHARAILTTTAPGVAPRP